MSLLGLFLFVFFFFIFPFVYLLHVFPFLKSLLFFSSKICLFMLVSFLPFFLLFRSLSTKYLVFLVSFSLFSTFSKTNSFFSGHLISFLVFLANKKSPCSNFHFDRPHSYTNVSRFFFHLLTLFMFPLLCMYPPDVLSLCPPSSLLLSFFCCQTLLSKKKKLFSPCYCCKTFVLLFSLLYHFPLFISFCETPSVFLLLFWFRLFSLLHFPILFFRKIKIFESKKSFSNIPKIVFLNFPLGLGKNLKNCSFNSHFWFFWTFEKMYFSLFFFEKKILELKHERQ